MKMAELLSQKVINDSDHFKKFEKVNLLSGNLSISEEKQTEDPDQALQYCFDTLVHHENFALNVKCFLPLDLN